MLGKKYMDKIQYDKVIFSYHGLPEHIAIIGAILGALALRLAAIYWRVTLPAFQIIDQEDDAKKP